MTTVAVLADPPEPGVALDGLAAESTLSEAEAATLYAATLRDVCLAVARSGGDLLVNYRPADHLDWDGDAEAAVRDALRPAIEDVDAVRFEVQVGSSLSARVGNTVTHLLEREGVDSAAVVDPTAALLGRTHVDSAAMKLRQSSVVLGPSTEGRVAFAAFAAPLDFEDAYASPAVETLTDRARDADLNVDFLETLPVVERGRDLSTVVSLLRARQRAEYPGAPHTRACVQELGLTVATDAEGRPEVVAGSADTDNS